MGKLISTMVKHSVRVLCKWVVIRVVYSSGGRQRLRPHLGLWLI